MSTPNDGGPAFARDSHIEAKAGLIVRQNGMSLRDYFAASALQAEWMDEYSVGKKTRLAYKVADAMLAERSRKEAQP